MRILDAASEEVLRIILDLYDGNVERSVWNETEVFPPAYDYSLGLEFEKLELYGMITSSTMSVDGSWGVLLTPQGITYFDDKSKAYEKEKTQQENGVKPMRKQYDVFISHANKDKSDYVDSLYMAIRKLGVNIFYDSEVLSWGDDWKKVLLEGTEKSEFAIIVISENFFGREWTERELEEFLKRQNTSGQKIVLPLLHNISLDMLKEQYPTLADIQCIDTERFSKEDITVLFAKELIKRLK
ncbi:MAG: toll/interleukin-1 receptor domain-containing protein [Clostridia bacterium]|nr:toll/interleukin-1 receptor domain-containing protein [Clostridia bacterium]